LRRLKGSREYICPARAGGRAVGRGGMCLGDGMSGELDTTMPLIAAGQLKSMSVACGWKESAVARCLQHARQSSLPDTA
jgi:hypothetical protein